MRKCLCIKPKKIYTSSPLPVIRRFPVSSSSFHIEAVIDWADFFALWSLILLVVKKYSRNEREGEI